MDDSVEIVFSESEGNPYLVLYAEEWEKVDLAHKLEGLNTLQKWIDDERKKLSFGWAKHWQITKRIVLWCWVK